MAFRYIFAGCCRGALIPRNTDYSEFVSSAWMKKRQPDLTEAIDIAEKNRLIGA
jgi:hypothetical protein